jgi:hypothetical protein
VRRRSSREERYQGINSDRRREWWAQLKREGWRGEGRATEAGEGGRGCGPVGAPHDSAIEGGGDEVKGTLTQQLRRVTVPRQCRDAHSQRDSDSAFSILSLPSSAVQCLRSECGARALRVSRREGESGPRLSVSVSQSQSLSLRLSTLLSLSLSAFSRLHCFQHRSLAVVFCPSGLLAFSHFEPPHRRKLAQRRKCEFTRLSLTSL